MKVENNLEPVYDKNSKILVLGTMPSVKSREMKFYYSHPLNRFWRVLAGILNSETPVTTEDKTKLLLDNNIAIWDMLESCDIDGSDDNSIKNPSINNIMDIISCTSISKIILNGSKAHYLYRKYFGSIVDIESICLPSTSPANASWSFDRLLEIWKKNFFA